MTQVDELSFDKGTATAPDQEGAAQSAKSRMRSQSSGEFVITHGWAFLIIGIIFVALYFLGAFRMSIGTAGICRANAGFTCTNGRLDSNYGDLCGGTYTGLGAYEGGSGYTAYPSLNITVSTTTGPWTNAYFAEVPNGQTINDVSTGADESQAYDFFYWEANIGRGAILTSLSNNQQMTVSMCMAPKYLPANSLGKSVSGTIWVMYSTLYVTNALAPFGTFTLAASR